MIVFNKALWPPTVRTIRTAIPGCTPEGAFRVSLHNMMCFGKHTIFTAFLLRPKLTGFPCCDALCDVETNYNILQQCLSR